jgi:hypothetical protein
MRNRPELLLSRSGNRDSRVESAEEKIKKFFSPSTRPLGPAGELPQEDLPLPPEVPPKAPPEAPPEAE